MFSQFVFREGFPHHANGLSFLHSYFQQVPFLLGVAQLVSELGFPGRVLTRFIRVCPSFPEGRVFFS